MPEVRNYISDPDVVDDFDRDQYAGHSDTQILRFKRARAQYELEQARKRLDSGQGSVVSGQTRDGKQETRDK
jgi:16S rRNA G1207 methylase RsmC